MEKVYIFACDDCSTVEGNTDKDVLESYYDEHINGDCNGESLKVYKVDLSAAVELDIKDGIIIE